MDRLKRSDLDTVRQFYNTAVPGTLRFNPKYFEGGVGAFLDQMEDFSLPEHNTPAEKLKSFMMAAFKGFDPESDRDLKSCFDYAHQAVSNNCAMQNVDDESFDRCARRGAHGVGIIIAALSQFAANDKAKWEHRGLILKNVATMGLSAGALAPASSAPAFALAGIISDIIIDHYMKSKIGPQTASIIAGKIAVEVTQHRPGVSKEERNREIAAANAFTTTLIAALQAHPVE